MAGHGAGLAGDGRTDAESRQGYQRACRQAGTGHRQSCRAYAGQGMWRGIAAGHVAGDAWQVMVGRMWQGCAGMVRRAGTMLEGIGACKLDMQAEAWW